jgi:hypothetical protein
MRRAKPPLGDVERSRRELARAQNEADWQATVMAILQAHGWTAFHINASIVRVTSGGQRTYATAVTSQGRGFPDVVAIRAGRMVFIECKSERGIVNAEQHLWHQRLSAVAGVEVYVLRPSDGQQLMEIAA